MNKIKYILAKIIYNISLPLEDTDPCMPLCCVLSMTLGAVAFLNLLCKGLITTFSTFILYLLTTLGLTLLLMFGFLIIIYLLWMLYHTCLNIRDWAENYLKKN